jgi:zinc transporter ZupT
MNINVFKGIATASIFAIGALGVLLPRFLPAMMRGGGRQHALGRVFGVLNAASAGVFISAGLLHLLADAISNEQLSAPSERFWGDEGRANIAISLCIAGFLFLLSAEQITHAWVERRASPLRGPLVARPVMHRGSHSSPESDQAVSAEVLPGRGGVVMVEGVGVYASDEPPASETSPFSHHSPTAKLSGGADKSAAAAGLRSADHHHSHQEPQQQHAAAAAAQPTIAVAVVIVLGLSVHSVLEGLALGAQAEVEQGVGIFVVGLPGPFVRESRAAI